MPHLSFYLEHMNEEEREVISKISEGETLSDTEAITAHKLYNMSLVYKDEKWKVFSTLLQKFINTEKSKSSKKMRVGDIFIRALAIISLVVALLGITSSRLMVDLMSSFFPDSLGNSTSLIEFGSLLTGFFSLAISILSFRISYTSLKLQQKRSRM